MSKYGINVPKGVAVSSVQEVKNVIQSTFPKEEEVSSFSFLPLLFQYLHVSVFVFSYRISHVSCISCVRLVLKYGTVRYFLLPVFLSPFLVLKKTSNLFLVMCI